MLDFGLSRRAGAGWPAHDPGTPRHHRPALRCTSCGLRVDRVGGNALGPGRGRASARLLAPGNPKATALRLRLALLRAVLVLVVLDRHRVDAAEPAVEVDIGAAPRAERAELRHRRLAADRARLAARRLAARGLGALGHATHMGTPPPPCQHQTALSQPKRIGKPSPDRSVIAS